MTLNELVDKMTFNDKLIKMCEEGDENWKELIAKQKELSEKLRTGDYTTDYYPMEDKEKENGK